MTLVEFKNGKIFMNLLYVRVGIRSEWGGSKRFEQLYVVYPSEGLQKLHI